MRRNSLIWTILAATLWLGACGDDTTTTVNANQPLGAINVSAGGSSSGTSSNVVISLEIAEPPTPKAGISTIDLIVESLVNEDEGTTRFIDVSELDPIAVGQLTNGVDDFMWIRTSIPTGGSGASGTSESNWFDGGLTGDWDPDFSGARITGFYLHFDQVLITNNGIEAEKATQYDLDYRVVVMGVPSN